jgi:hypothetical protein
VCLSFISDITAATSKKKQAEYDKRKYKKMKMKRSLDKTFDKGYKQKQALKQRKRRISASLHQVVGKFLQDTQKMMESNM